MSDTRPDILDAIEAKFGEAVLARQTVRDGVPTVWVRPDAVKDALEWLKNGIDRPYKMLYDLFGVDERAHTNGEGRPASDFTVVYQLFSFDRNEDIRLKVPLTGERPTAPSITGLWPSANWYERETWDMFGVRFEGHPHLERILMPAHWQGHPLRKDHPARATEMPPFEMSAHRRAAEQHDLQFQPEDWGLERRHEDIEFMFLNIGPQHPGTHGLLRIILQLDDETIVDAVPDIGYHHRGAEKMGERQTWHTYIPYTDRVDYLGGVMNNLAYLLAVERLAGIEVPPRAQVIRVMMCELFRIASHLVWYGTFVQDIGYMSAVFYMFNDRERLFDIVEAVCGERMHPNWFRIGGVAQDLPKGWERLVRDFVEYLPARINEYDNVVMRNRIFKMRTQGVGIYTAEEAIDWGATGPGLRACGLEWDLRKKKPYSGYDQFDFEIPTAQAGDCYARAEVHVEEMRQSLRIVAQCLKNMPEGPYISDHPLATPPAKARTMRDIESLINHFVHVSWGPVIPPGEASFRIEATKGWNGYHLISDGNVMSYRTRIRTPSFAHMQMIPLMCKKQLIPDLLAILGSIDYVLADIDR